MRWLAGFAASFAASACLAAVDDLDRIRDKSDYNGTPGTQAYCVLQDSSSSTAKRKKCLDLVAEAGGSEFQALCSDLTSICALTTTAFGRGALESADAAAFRTYIGAGSGGGSVTSVGVSGADGIGVSGSPITTSGIIALTLGNITPDSVSTPGTITAVGTITLDSDGFFYPAFQFSDTLGNYAQIGGFDADMASNANLLFRSALSGTTDYFVYETLAQSLLNKKLGSLTSNGFVKTSGGDGTLSVDTASYQPLDSDLTSWAAVTRASGFDTFAATPSSANLRSLLTDEAGTGPALFGSLTEGRVTFAGPGGDPDDDAALLWDDTNKRLGIGATPATPIDAYDGPENITDSVGHTTHNVAFRFLTPSTLTAAASNESLWAETLLDHGSNQSVLAVTTGLIGRASVARANTFGIATLEGAGFLSIPQSAGAVVTARGSSSGIYRDEAGGSITTGVGSDFFLTLLNNTTISTAAGWRVRTPNGRVSGSPNTTWTQIYGGCIQDQKPSGASSTLTNPPIGLQIDSQTASGAYAIKTATGLVYFGDVVTALSTIELGHASDTTLSRSSAGNVAVEGNVLYRAGGTDVPVADGGTGVSSATAYALIAGGTTSTGALQSLAAGATTEILVGGGASALPVWTTATGTGAPVRAGSNPAFTSGLSVASTAQVMFDGGTGNQSIRQNASSGLVFKTGGSDRLVIANGGAASLNAFMAIGTSAAPGTSIALDVVSTTGAFVPPRMTTTQRDALTAANGMMIYNTTTGALNYYKAGVWTAI